MLGGLSDGFLFAKLGSTVGPCDAVRLETIRLTACFSFKEMVESIKLAQINWAVRNTRFDPFDLLAFLDRLLEYNAIEVGWHSPFTIAIPFNEMINSWAYKLVEIRNV